MSQPGGPRFQPGRVLMTPGAVDAMKRHRKKPSEFLTRHLVGDWGDLEACDRRANDRALKPADPHRIFSAYRLDAHDTLWVITERDRSVTTILLPSEY